MVEVPVHKAATQFVEAWEAVTRERLAHKPPARQDRRNLLGPYFSPEKLRDGVLAVGFDDADRLKKLARSTGVRRSRGWPAGAEVPEVQRLGVALTRELSAGAGRAYSHEVQDRRTRILADAVGTSVGRFHYSHVVDQLAATQAISKDVERALRSGNDWAQRTPREPLVEAFAATVDPVEARRSADGRLLDRMHTSEQPDKARVATETLVNRSTVFQQAGHAVRTAEAARAAEATAASRLAGEGVLGAGATGADGAGTSGAERNLPATLRDRGTGARAGQGNALG